MLSLPEKLSPRLRFWVGFACCPLLTWVSIAVLVFSIVQTNRFWAYIPPHLSSYTTGVLTLSAVTYAIGAPLFAGFATALFWRHFKRPVGDEEAAGFWSIVLTWSPMLALLVIQNPVSLLFLFFPFTMFTLLYVAGLRRGLVFWNSNRLRHWFGDFSDMS